MKILGIRIGKPDKKLLEACAELVKRQNRTTNPEGRFDKQGRWDPSNEERQKCCDGIRSPSRAFPYSYMVHCRTADHVAKLYGVDTGELKRAYRDAMKASDPTYAAREGGDNYYKAVAWDEDAGSFISIYDGITRYQFDKTIKQNAKQNHGGGFYVYRTIDAARSVQVPSSSSARDLPRHIIQCRGEGSYCVYDNGKIAFSKVTPLCLVG